MKCFFTKALSTNWTITWRQIYFQSHEQLRAQEKRLQHCVHFCFDWSKLYCWALCRVEYVVVMGASSQFLALFHPKQALHWSQTNALFTHHWKEPGLGCITLHTTRNQSMKAAVNRSRYLETILTNFPKFHEFGLILNTDREPFSFILLRSRQFGLFVCICVWLCFSSLSTTTDYPTSLTWWCCHLYFNKLLSSHSHPLRFNVTFFIGFHFRIFGTVLKTGTGKKFPPFRPVSRA